MSVSFCFILFLVAMAVCVALGQTAVPALLLGILLFGLLGWRKGFTLAQMWDMMRKEGKKLISLLGVFLAIGAIMGLWRASGTITFFIYYGIQIITPRSFLLVAFLLTSLLSYALGTAFGVTGTAGIILMALARSGNVSEILTAGAILSGAYFGDRCSPASSSAALVAAITQTDQRTNMRNMFRTGLLPMVLSIGIYGVLSVSHPIRHVDANMLQVLADNYQISLWTVVPAVLMLILPLLRMSIRNTLTISCVAAFFVAVFVQEMGVGETLYAAVLGYTPHAAELTKILAGGGVISMVTSSVMVMITGLYAGLLIGLGALDGAKTQVEKISGRWGLFPAMVLTCIAAGVTLCNQSIMVMMGEPLLRDVYAQQQISREELAVDLENSGIVLAALIPWNIAGSIPLQMLGVGPAAIPCMVLLYMIPLCHGLTKRWIKCIQA